MTDTIASGTLADLFDVTTPTITGLAKRPMSRPNEAASCARFALDTRKLGNGMNTPHRIVLGSVIALSFILFAAQVSAQSPPTATEAFNLRIQCKKLSDEKAQDGLEINRQLGWEIVTAWNTSKYDPGSNRCYGRKYQHIVKKSYRFNHENDQVFDLQTDDLLASSTIKNGKKDGIIFDPDFRMT